MRRTKQGPLNLLALLLALVAAADSQTFPSGSHPRPIKTVAPSHTKEALDAKLQGVVVLKLTVEVDGTPSGIKVVRGLGKGLGEKAIECLEQWRFKPGTNDIEAIPSNVQVEIIFRLPHK